MVQVENNENNYSPKRLRAKNSQNYYIIQKHKEKAYKIIN